MTNHSENKQDLFFKQDIRIFFIFKFEREKNEININKSRMYIIIIVEKDIYLFKDNNK